jgi:hypothetical protein
LDVVFENSGDRGKFDCEAVRGLTQRYIRKLVPEIDEQVKDVFAKNELAVDSRCVEEWSDDMPICTHC